MLRFLIPRLVRMIVTLCGVVTIVFGLSRLSGDPVALMVPPGTPIADIELLRHQLGLDAPIPVQYASFWSGLLHGDFGTSLVYRAPALEVVAARLPATAELGLCSMALSVGLGLSVGVLGAARPDGLFGRLAVFLAVAGRATPPFVFGIFLIIVLSIELRLLPSGGSGQLSNFVMPSATLAFATLPTIVRITRSGMLEAMRHDYVRTARAKGLATATILWRHALRNASLPIVTVIGIQFGSLLGGVAIVETLFAWPGLGYLAITSISQRDYPVIQTVLLVGAFWFVVANTAVDLAYAALDPRARVG
jgi:ABC-type dipeptide/oligopeptide/nickel transport system permease component